MRNWNLVCIRPHISDVFSFEPTYEELKPTTASRIIIIAPRFEPTYEELKQITDRTYITPFTRFEPTYEELKLFM